MGWSCSARAGLRLEAITNHCVAQTGSQNVFVGSRGERLFFETSRREHDDGSITGTIRRESDGSLAGSFRINADGTWGRGPRALSLISAYVMIVDGNQSLWRGETPTDEVLRIYLKGEYMKQFYKGGVNYHITESLGYVPYPSRAVVVDLVNQRIVARWKAAMFEAW